VSLSSLILEQIVIRQSLRLAVVVLRYVTLRYAGLLSPLALHDDDVLLFVCLFVRLSPSGTCRALACLAQQRNSAGSREWPERNLARQASV